MPAPVALISGGEGDLAGVLRTALQEHGWTVVAPGRREMDVTSAESVHRFMSGLARLDLLVNNAGLRRDESLVNQKTAQRDAVIDVCLRGAFLCSREAARIMAQQRTGHIVNIGSHSALTGPIGQTAYAAAKAGLTALTKSLAAELGADGIRVNCVLPGWLETRFTESVPASARVRALAAHVLGRFNTPDDTARFVVFLHSLTAVSGQVFSLDSRIPRSGA